MFHSLCSMFFRRRFRSWALLGLSLAAWTGALVLLVTRGTAPALLVGAFWLAVRQLLALAHIVVAVDRRLFRLGGSTHE